MTLPRITIVTPSYNQGPFLEETIESVLGQGYPNLEYIVVDGGSTDESSEIIDRYQRHLAWSVSEPDDGQPHAINKGFQRATGDVFAYINSDDLLEPGSLALVGDRFASGTRWLSGSVRYFGSSLDGKIAQTRQEHRVSDWFGKNIVPQQGSFWHRELTETLGPFREDLHFVFDYEYWLRFRIRGNVAPEICDDVLAAFRMHADAKTSAAPEAFERELASVRTHYRALVPRSDRWRAWLQERRVVAGYHQRVAIERAALGERASAGRLLMRSLTEWPLYILSRRTFGVAHRIMRAGDPVTQIDPIAEHP